MKLETLPSPGAFPNAHALVQQAVKAISYAEVQAEISKGQSDAAERLGAFFAELSGLCAEINSPYRAQRPATARGKKEQA